MIDRRTLLAALCAAPALVRGNPLPQAAWPAAEWTTRPPAESGWSADGLQQASERARLLGSDAVLVVHRGAIVHAVGDVARPLPAYSVRKSVLGVLFGMLHARQPLDLQATLAQLDIDDEQGLTEAERRATLQQLLQSRSGVYHPAAYETAAMSAARPARGSHAPGSFWYYNNWDFNALGSIYRQLAGHDVFDGVERELAGPLGWQDFRRAEHTQWAVERSSRHGAYTMMLSARDLARLGLLMARGGRWQGRALLPEAWVDEGARAVSVLPGGWLAYGQLWWMPQRAWPFWPRQPGQLFFASGNFGQFMWVDRARDLVVVHRTSGFSLLRTEIDTARVSPLLAAIMAAAPPQA